MGTKKNNHTDPMCFRCFESDFRWYFQWTFSKIKNVGKIKNTLKNVKNVPWIKNVKKRFLHHSSQGISQFYLHLHTHTFIRNRNEPYLPLPSQPQLVLIYRPRRDGRLRRPWCEVAQAKIRTRYLPIANPALYHTATSAPSKTNANILYAQ